MSTNDYDDSEGPHDDDTWRCICVLGAGFVIVALGVIIAALFGAF